MEATIKAWHGKPRLSVYPAPSNPERCTDRALQICAELAQALRHRHPHAPSGNQEAGGPAPRRGSARPVVAHLDELGVLSGPVVLRAQHLAQRTTTSASWHRAA